MKNILIYTMMATLLLSTACKKTEEETIQNQNTEGSSTNIENTSQYSPFKQPNE